MRHNHHMKKLAILYFEGKATDEEELRLLEFIKESAHNRAAFAEWEEEWTHSHTPDPRPADRGCMGGAEGKDEEKARRAGHDRRITAYRTP